ncbi:RCC1/BLIP-II [Heliocybe sulcata]|uniref:RCC1/BLIP-II n=1 Tax=Heliocybe sulcata TaxID=5364 RepID=A0A5C3MX85_9AGAM|nr:RCC1/BLIP-II [Heliocybe sulcata]
MSATPAPATASGQERPAWGRGIQHSSAYSTRLANGGPKLGRKDRAGGVRLENPDHPDLLEPHILRSLSNVKAVSIHASCAGCHCVVIDVDGAAWTFGRNEKACQGLVGVECVWETAPRRVTPADLGAHKGTKFVHAGCGRNHTLLVGSEGQVWSAGMNNLGQCGHNPCAEVSSFKLVNGPWKDAEDRVIQAAAGITFSIVLTESGKVYSFGSGEKGQLGNGRTGEHIVTGNKTAYDVESEPILVRGLEGKNIVEIACGQQHSIALDDTGLVFVWGFNGYCRLGLGHQKDILTPQSVPQFSGPNEATMAWKVVAGPTNSVVIDKQRMFWMAGKWKTTGDGSGGQAYSSFRYIQDIMGCKMFHASCGGVTHWALAPDEDGTIMTIAWGQSAVNGELGLGPDEPKSATKPTRHQPLIGIDVFDVAAGQNTTFFLARPNEKFSDLPRHPVDVDAPELCLACGKENGEDDSPLACDKCDNPYHLKCLEPPLDAVPEGEWFCPQCEAEAAARTMDGVPSKKRKSVQAGGLA